MDHTSGSCCTRRLVVRRSRSSIRDQPRSPKSQCRETDRWAEEESLLILKDVKLLRQQMTQILTMDEVANSRIVVI